MALLYQTILKEPLNINVLSWSVDLLTGKDSVLMTKKHIISGDCALARGFTLIELSIVLVIVALLAGGVVAGRQLIEASTVRATITQIEQVRLATNAFKLKYGALPGDLHTTKVATLGFQAAPANYRPGNKDGLGDGNGIVSGYYTVNAGTHFYLTAGETAWFWVDLTTNSGMLPGNLDDADDLAWPVATTYDPSRRLPRSKIGNTVYLHTYYFPGKPLTAPGSADGVAEGQYLSLSHIGYLDMFGSKRDFAATQITGGGVSVSAAYAIDSKVDDGRPTSGRVIAAYDFWYISMCTSTWDAWWATGGPNCTDNRQQLGLGLPTVSIPADKYSCFDDENGALDEFKYTLSVDNGTNRTCGLSFRF